MSLNNSNKRTKIVCTIGPASEDPKILTKMVKAGMNVARLNFSHGTHANHRELMKNIRSVAKKLNQPIAIMQDLQGPKIRVGNLPEKGVMLRKGSKMILTTSTNLLVGMTNLVSLGQAAFYGLGAYFSVLALMIFHFPLIPSLIIAMIFTAIVSLFIAYPSLRLKDDYFILATLGFQLITYTILYNWISLTRGPYGIPGIPAPKLLGIIPINGILPFFILSSIFSILTISPSKAEPKKRS